MASRLALVPFRPESKATVPADFPHWIVAVWGRKVGEIARLREPRPDGSRWVGIKVATCERRYFRKRSAARDWTAGLRDFPELSVQERAG